MKKAKNKFNNKIKYLMFAIMAITGILFVSGAFSPDNLIGIASILPITFLLKGVETVFTGKELTEEKQAELQADEIVGYYNAVNKWKRAEVDKLISTKADQTEIDEMRKEYQNMKDIQLKQIMTILEAQGLELAKVKREQTETPKKSFVENLKDSINVLLEKGSGTVKVKGNPLTKSAGTMTFGTNVTGQIPQADREPGITNVVRRRFVVRDAADVSTTTSNLLEWVEQQNIDGSAGMTSEGSAKTQLDWDYIVRNEKIEKITSFVKITKEMLQDIPTMMAEINGNLKYQIDLLEETQLISGSGVTPNINGISVYAQTLDIAALANSVSNPNNWDVLGAAITQVTGNSEQNFYPNVILMNPVDVFLSIHNTKATTKEYINPVTVVPGVGATGVPNVYVWGVPVLPTNSITAGQYIVADMSKFHIKDKEAFNIQIGWVNDDFTKNLVTILGEKRLGTYVKTNEVEAFVKDTFALGITYLDNGS